ncbi:Cystathionine gamma-lyase [Trichuris trichiura]|uniref:cystathionine gamma-lyase n=1 Tax=Trichuris trichiura TaxID=36087 RepID=A0A077ZGF9_TRITR|nr:Cystathionine gamma-lyase [Trichuris trichiura]
MEKFAHFATDALHVGQEPDQWAHHEIVPPICLATTFKQPAPAQPKTFDYARGGNATRFCLEQCIASLEAAKYCKTFASGLAAISAITAILKPGDAILALSDMYGGTMRFFNQVLGKVGIKYIMADFVGKNVEEYLTPDVKMIWIESPTNPLLRIVDIKEVCAIAKKTEGLLTVVDNTFMSPYFQRPLALGASMTVHSVTKYINGHSDVIMGCVCTDSKEIFEHLNFQQLAVGAVPSPFDCYLVNRGIKTLHLRMRAHEENGFEVARFLEKHPLVESVIFPGLSSHPQHELHVKQTTGTSGMVSFYIRGSKTEAVTFLKSLKVSNNIKELYIIVKQSRFLRLLSRSEDTKVWRNTRKALMTHASVPEKIREQLGITDNLIRLSVGLEDPEDLKADLDNALKATQCFPNGI